MINKGKVIERLENRQGPDIRRAWSSEEAPTPSRSRSGKHWNAMSRLSLAARWRQRHIWGVVLELRCFSEGQGVLSHRLVYRNVIEECSAVEAEARVGSV